MRVSQILNNNVAIAKRGSSEVIVYAKGLAFRKKPGDVIDSGEIEKTYVLDSHDKLEHFSYLLSNTQEEYLQIVNEIIAYGEERLHEKMSDYLYLALVDHLYVAIRRMKKDQFIRSPLYLEVKKFYPEYYGVGTYAVSVIRETLKIQCPEEEAASIALHFINQSEGGHGLAESIRIMDTVRDILSIIRYHYRQPIDEESTDYIRLVTHVEYFARRLVRQAVADTKETELYYQIRKLYPSAYSCIQKIQLYVKETFGCEMSKDEEAYIMLHVHRVTQEFSDKKGD